MTATIVAALGGNALLRRGEPLTIAAQTTAAQRATAALAEVATDHAMVITHGNGPQVGLLALRSMDDEGGPSPLDVLDAQTQGMIGYLLEQSLANALPRRDVVTLLTRIVVDADDPAFGRPTKPIGPMMGEGEAQDAAAARGWTVARDGDGWRRVVPSPEPKRIVHLPIIRLLLEHGAVPIAVGGGGIPVVVEPDGASRGVEAVIDKDLASALLGIELGADGLLLLTDVDAIMRGWGTDQAQPVRRATPGQLRALDLPAGSMGPKAEAAARFVEATGGWAVIGRLDRAADAVAGRAGTRVTAAS